MIIACFTNWSFKLPAPSDLLKDSNGVHQVVINVGNDNFGEIYPKEHVEFIGRPKNAGKHSIWATTAIVTIVPKSRGVDLLRMILYPNNTTTPTK